MGTVLNPNDFSEDSKPDGAVLDPRHFVQGTNPQGETLDPAQFAQPNLPTATPFALQKVLGDSGIGGGSDVTQRAAQTALAGPSELPPPSPFQTAVTRTVNVVKNIPDVYQNWWNYWMGKARSTAPMDQQGPTTASILSNKANKVFSQVHNLGDQLNAMNYGIITDPATGIPKAIDQTKVLVGGLFRDTGTILKQSWANAREQGPVNFAESLATGILVDPALDLARLMTGQTVDEATLRGLNPQEMADEIVRNAANVGAVAVGWGTGKAVNGILNGSRGMAGVVSLEDLADRAALPLGVPTSLNSVKMLRDIEASKGLVENNLARGLIRHAATGFAAGNAYGMIQGAGDDNMAAKMLAYGLQFAPIGIGLGVVVDGLGGFQDKFDPSAIRFRAGQLANLKQFRATASTAVPDIFARNEALAGSRSPASALAWLSGSDEITHIRNVSGPELNDIKNIGSTLKNYNYFWRVSPDFIPGGKSELINGQWVETKNEPTFDALLIGSDAVPDMNRQLDIANSWRNSGLPVGLQVSYNGKDFFVEGVDKLGRVHLRVPGGPGVIADARDVSYKTSPEFGGAPEPTKTTATLKTQIASYYQGSPKKEVSFERYTPIRNAQDQNIETLKAAKTGGPIDLVGFRYQRGTPVGGVNELFHTGTFYGAKLTDAIAYSGGIAPREIMQGLLVHDLHFENPYIVDGGHYTMVRQLFFDHLKDKGIDLKPIAEATGDINPDVIYRAATSNPEVMDRVSPIYKKLLAANKAEQSGRFEQGYQLEDKIIGAILRERGHDGLIYRKTNISPGLGTPTNEIVALDPKLAPVDAKLTLNLMKTLHEPSMDAVYNEYYDGWKRSMGAVEGKPIEDIVASDFNKSVEGLAEHFEITDPKAIENLKNEIGRRAYAELREKIFTDQEKSLFARLTKQKYDDMQAEQLGKKITYSRLIDTANRNGMYVEQEGAGTIAIRNLADDELLGKAKSLEDVHDFLVKTGVMDNGVKLDGGGAGGGVPPEIAGGDMAQPEPPSRPNEPKIYPNNSVGKIQQLIYAGSAAAKALLTNPKLFPAIDVANKGATDLTNRVYKVIQDGLHNFYSKLNNVAPMAERLQNEYRDLTLEDRIKVGEALETMTPAEVIDHYFQFRRLHKGEVNLGEWMAKNEVDLKKLFNYREARRIGTEGMTQGSDEYNAKIDEIKEKLGLNNDPVTWEAIQQTDDLNGSIGGAIRLARSISNQELSREDFMRANNFSGKQRKLVGEIENIFGMYADEFGIPDYKRLSNYMTHIRLYNDGNFTPRTVRATSIPGDPSTEFYARLARTGEIDAYERDPIVALLKYIRSGYKADELMPAIKQARANMREELGKVDNTDTKAAMAAVYQQYENDALGVPARLDKNIEGIINPVLRELGATNGVDVRKIVNGLLSYTETAAQGAKVAAGVRDFVQNLLTYWVNRGSVRTARYLMYGLNGAEISGKMINQASLQAQGVVTGLSPLLIETPSERGAAMFDAGSVARGYNKFAQMALDLSLQPWAYRVAQTGAYLDMLKEATDRLNEYAKQKITKAEAFKRIGVGLYEHPFRQQFEKLVDAGQYERAAEYMAETSAQQDVVRYGMANNLHFSRNLVGRMFGQFGTWSSFTSSNIIRGATNGTIGEISARTARAAAATALIAYAAKKSHINLGGWYLTPGSNFVDDDAPIFPTGQRLYGPMMQEAVLVNDFLTGEGWKRKQAWSELARSFPLDANGNLQLKHLWLPGSFAADGLMRAYAEYKSGDPVRAAIYATGLREQREKGGYGFKF